MMMMAEAHQRVFLLADEVEIGVAEQLHHRELLEPPLLFGDLEHHASEIKHGEQADDEADEQRDGEAANLVGADHVENDGTNQRGDVRVDDRGKGPVKAVVNRHPQAGAAFAFFAHSLVDQHVRVDRDTDRQRDTGQTRAA